LEYQAVHEMSAMDQYTVKDLTVALGISRQVYYKWLNRQPNERDLFIAEL